MRMLSMANVIITLTLIFILGLSVHVYRGNELEYKGLQSMNESNSSVMQRAVYKIVDGTMMLCFETANLISEYAKLHDYDLEGIFKAVKWILSLLIVGWVISVLVKLFVYVYVLRKELRMSRIEKEFLKGRMEKGVGGSPNIV